jgi:DNA-directed RNA polymerase specialized sigma24 family protein
MPRLPSAQPSAVGRKIRRYQKHREEKLDSVIRDQTRARQIEDGLGAILAAESRVDEWKRNEYTEIVDRTLAGDTAQQIAVALGLTLRTVERRLSEVRQAAVAKEEKALASEP